jgi:UPF0271 protein
MRSIDLNSDVGEGFGYWRPSEDERILAHLSSANVACGFHAGDPTIMRTTCAAAMQHRVALGAHVGYPDLAGFGRRAMALSTGEVRDGVVYQLGALEACALSVGGRLRHVKPHGALYTRATIDAETARAIAEAVALVDDSLRLLGPPASELASAARRLGLAFIAEGFADRAYMPDGTLARRSQNGSVFEEARAVEQGLSLAIDRRVQDIEGNWLELEVESICIHSDSPGAADAAKALATALAGARVSVAAS